MFFAEIDHRRNVLICVNGPFLRISGKEKFANFVDFFGKASLLLVVFLGK